MVDNEMDKNCLVILDEMQKLGINCGREIGRLAKVIHPDCVAVVPLYRSCIVIIQSEQEKEDGVCTVHAYGDPHWLGGDINIDSLKRDEFHFKFKIEGKRGGPELIFTEEDKTVQMPISNGFDLIELGIKEMERTIEKEIQDEEKLDIYDN